MGTDIQGRDMFSRILYGAQISLQVGVVAVIMALAMGGLIGAIAGGLGGRVDSVLMRSIDVLLAIPGILLAIGIMAWLDRGLLQIMLAVAITYVPIFARILRGSHARPARVRLRDRRSARSAPPRSGSCSGTCCPMP